MNLLWALAVGALGLPIAGWARAQAVIHSVPPGCPWRRRCPHCDAALAGHARLVTWLPPNGRCPACRNRIGPLAGSVEAVLALGLGVLMTATTDTYLRVALAITAVIGVTLSFVDLAVQRLPDRLTAAAFLGTAMPLFVGSMTHGGWADARRAIYGALATSSFYLVLALFAGGGLGDAKLALTSGLVLGALGWTTVIAGGFLGIVITATAGASMRLTGHLKRGDHIAHGPGILAGAGLAIVII